MQNWQPRNTYRNSWSVQDTRKCTPFERLTERQSVQSCWHAPLRWIKTGAAQSRSWWTPRADAFVQRLHHLPPNCTWYNTIPHAFYHNSINNSTRIHLFNLRSTSIRSQFDINSMLRRGNSDVSHIYSTLAHYGFVPLLPNRLFVRRFVFLGFVGTDLSTSRSYVGLLLLSPLQSQERPVHDTNAKRDLAWQKHPTQWLKSREAWE